MCLLQQLFELWLRQQQHNSFEPKIFQVRSFAGVAQRTSGIKKANTHTHHMKRGSCKMQVDSNIVEVFANAPLYEFHTIICTQMHLSIYGGIEIRITAFYCSKTYAINLASSSDKFALFSLLAASDPILK